MTAYRNRSRAELEAEYSAVQADYANWKAQGLKLNMARGKPGKEQLDLVSGLLNTLHTPEDCITDGLDTRNYGELSGLPAAKQLFADILGCTELPILAQSLPASGPFIDPTAELAKAAIRFCGYEVLE